MNEGKPNSVSASHRSVSIGGDARNNVITTGDGNTVQAAGVDLETFLQALAELRRQVRASELPDETAEVVEAELVDAEERARGEKPNATVIAGRLRTVVDLLKDAAAVGRQLVPAARQLGEWAGTIF